MRSLLLSAVLGLGACAGDQASSVDAPGGGGGDAPGGGGADAPGGGGADAAPDAFVGPNVDRSNPMLYDLSFSADDADATAAESLGTQHAELDTRVEPANKLVVYLHGAAGSAPTSCGSTEMGRVLAGMGFHVFQPCYNSYYGVGNCGDDIGGCRLEAFEGVDHTAVIDIAPADSIETRIVKGLEHLATLNPAGDWGWFVVGGQPRWDAIVISGISHGASSSGLIGHVRRVDRSVMLSGPFDTDQAWLAESSLTPADRFFGFSHTADSQHAGHLAAWGTMGLTGTATSIDGATPPYGGSHRLITSAATTDGHSSVQAGGSSPMDGSDYVFEPAWRILYGR